MQREFAPIRRKPVKKRGPAAKAWLAFREQFLARYTAMRPWVAGDACPTCASPAASLVLHHLYRRGTHRHLTFAEENISVGCSAPGCHGMLLDTQDRRSVARRAQLLDTFRVNLLRGRAPWLPAITTAQFREWINFHARPEKIGRRGHGVVG